MDGAKLSDVKITNLKEIFDNRGSILHMLRSDSEDFKSFGECYFSEIYPGKIKAWKKHDKQTQNLSVPIGKIKLVLIDTDNKLIEYELGRPNFYFRVTIPPGIIYGFKCLSDEKALIVNCTDIPHDSSESQIISVKEIDFYNFK